MSNPWFRLYAEFAHDPKVQMMPEVMQRRYVMLMCMRCSNVTETLHETEIAFYLRISDQDLIDTKALFVSKGFIDNEWNLLNWEKRQFASDSSTVRVAKHREKKKKESNGDVTLPETKGNGLDTDTDTDTDTEKKEQNPAPEKSPAFVLPDWIDSEKWALWLKTRKKKMIPEQMQANVAKLEKWKNAGLDYAGALADAADGGWQGLHEPKSKHGVTSKHTALVDSNRAAADEWLRQSERVVS